MSNDDEMKMIKMVVTGDDVETMFFFKISQRLCFRECHNHSKTKWGLSCVFISLHKPGLTMFRIFEIEQYEDDGDDAARGWCRQCFVLL